MRNDAPILHRSHSTPAPTLHKRASSGTGAQIVPLMPSRVKSEKPADEDDILDYSVWEKEVEALSARVQRLASISRCPELIAVARQHSRKAEHDRVVRTAEPVSLIPDWSFFHPRRELEDFPDAEQKKEKKLLEKQVQKQKKEAARAEKKKKKAIVRIAKAPREPDSSDSEDDMSSDEPYDIEPYDRAQQDWQRRRNARRNARRWRRRQERLLNIFSNLFSF